MADAQEQLSDISCFDRFTLDLRRGLLLGPEGEEIPLRPKSFALLRTPRDAGPAARRNSGGRSLPADRFRQATPAVTHHIPERFFRNLFLDKTFFEALLHAMRGVGLPE